MDLSAEDLRCAQAGYFGLISHIDDLLPGLLDEFKKKSEGMNRPWIIVFTSDHGEMLGDHYLFRKCEPYEGSSRIPFLIQGSAELDFAPETQYAKPVCLEDIMPTLLDLANIPVPENIDGQSLVSVLRGEDVTVRTMLHAEHAPCYDAEQAYHFLTDGRTKYIWRPSHGSEQLFDLRSDPREICDLSRRSDRATDLTLWRTRLVDHLKSRPEGFSDGKRLMSNRPYDAVLPHARPS